MCLLKKNKKCSILLKIILIIVILSSILFLTLDFVANFRNDILESKESAKTMEVDLSEIMFIYRVYNAAWGNVDYAYIINGNGVVKLIDFTTLTDKYIYYSEKSEELLSVLEDCMKNSEIPILTQVDKISDDVFERLCEIGSIKLKKNRDVNWDQGTFSYYFVHDSGEKKNLVLLQQLGDNNYVSKDKDVLKICDIIDTIIDNVMKIKDR